MTNLRVIQQTINSKSFLTPQQSICIKGGTDNEPIPTPPIELEGEGEDKRRKRKPALSI